MRKLITLITLTLIFGCNSKINKSKQNFVETTLCEVNINDAKKYKIYDFFKAISFQSLEKTEESLISEISQIKKKNNKYYVRDASQNILFVFDYQGKFVFKIDNKGRGPNEYFRIDDFIIEDDGNILIFDALPKQVIHFDKTGAFIKTNKNSFGSYYFEKLNDSILCFTAGNYCNEDFCSSIILQNIKTQKTEHFLKIDNNLKNLSYQTSKPLYKINKELYYLDVFTQKTYQISAKGIENSKKMDFGNIMRPENWIYEKNWRKSGNLTMKSIKYGYASLIDNFIENEFFIFFTFVHKSKLYYYCFNKRENITKLAEFPFYHKKKQTSIMDKIIGSNKGIITAIGVDRLKENINIFNSEQAEIIKSFNDNDNSILVEFTF